MKSSFVVSRKTPSENCLFCAYYFLILFLVPSGVTSFNFFCHHTQIDSYYAIKASKVKQISCLIITATYFFVSIWALCDSIASSSKITYTQSIKLATTILFEVKSILTVFIAVYSSKTGIRCFEGVVQLSKCYKSYSMKTFLPKKFVSQTRRKSKGFLVLVLFVSISHISLLFQVYDSGTLLGAYKIFSGIFCLYIDVSALFFYWMTTSLFGELFSQVLTTIEGLLASARTTNRVDHLTGLRKFYMALLANYKLFFVFWRPTVVIWVTLANIILVFNLYIMVATDLEAQNSILNFRNQCTTILLISSVVMVQKNAEVGNNIQSFLFRYPITKLSTSEAAQVEMLITTLNLQKPVIKASDFFTVGTKLIASIAGTVVTYVLVALQLRTSWIVDTLREKSSKEFHL